MPFLDFPVRETYDHRMKPCAVFVVASLAIGGGAAHAQSLADVARSEAARRKEVEKATKVYTNDNIRPDPTTPVPSAPPPASDTSAKEQVAPTSATAEAPREGAGQVRDQAYWAGRMSEARSQLQRSTSFAQALQNRIDMLWADFVNRDNPVERATIEQERNAALAELSQLQREIDEQTKAIAAIEDEARREGVPSGWLRSS